MSNTGLGRVGISGSGFMPDWSWDFSLPGLIQAGLSGLGAIAATLETNKRAYQVGDTPTYTIRAAIPGSRIAWTSFKNGQHTGEFQADYGDVVGPNGTVELVAGGAWTDDSIGQWEKQALIIAPDGATSLAQVFFTVSPKAAASTTPTTPVTSEGFLDGSFDIAGYEVPKIAAYAGAGIGLYWLFGRRR